MNCKTVCSKYFASYLEKYKILCLNYEAPLDKSRQKFGMVSVLKVHSVFNPGSLKVTFQVKQNPLKRC